MVGQRGARQTGGPHTPVRMMRRVAAGFYRRPTLTVARALVGKVLVHVARAGTTAGRIVEVEAYIGETDPACHAAPGWTPRNAPLYGPAGRAYVYLNYGIHQLVNVVTEPEGAPAAILLRAVEPLAGIDLMARRRARGGRAGPLDRTQLCRGPGNLTRAMGITSAFNRIPLDGERLYIADAGGDELSAEAAVSGVEWSPRIGIRVATARRWRCSLTGSAFVSGPPRMRRTSLPQT